MKIRFLLFCAILAVLWAAGKAQAWDYYYIPAERDSYFVTGDVDSSAWADNSIDSADYQCVNEAAENPTNYIYKTSTSNSTNFFTMAIDTTYDYDSVAIVAYATYNETGAGTKTLAFRADTSTSTNTFEVSQFESGENGAFVGSMSTVLTGLSNAALDYLKIGIYNVDDPAATKQIQADWVFAIAWKATAAPDSHRVWFHDTSDFRLFQMAEVAGGDDKWMHSACTTGAVGGNEYRMGAWVNRVQFDSSLVGHGLDSAKLHIPIKDTVGNVYELTVSPILSDEDYDLHDASTGDDVTGLPAHMEWANRASAVTPSYVYDTSLANADGDTLEWSNSPADSAAWWCVGQGDADYVFTATRGETELLRFETDVGLWAQVDSALPYIRAKSGTSDTLIILIDTAGTVVPWDTIEVTGAYATYPVKALIGLTETQWDSLQIGFYNQSEGNYYVTIFTVQIYGRAAIPWASPGADGLDEDYSNIEGGDITSFTEGAAYDWDATFWGQGVVGIYEDVIIQIPGTYGPALLLSLPNGDTAGNHYMVIDGGSDSVYLELFLGTYTGGDKTGEQLAGYTFGNTAYQTGYTTMADKIQISRFNFASGGDVLSMTAMINPQAVGVTYKYVIYTDSTGGIPGHVLACTEAGSSFRSVIHYSELLFATPQTLAAGNYWLGVWADGSNNTFRVYEASTGTSNIDASEAYTGDCGALAPTWTSGVKNMSIFATYRKATSAEIYGAHGGFTGDYEMYTSFTKNRAMSTVLNIGVSGNTYYYVNRLRELDRILPANSVIDSCKAAIYVSSSGIPSDSVSVTRVFKPFRDANGIGGTADTTAGAIWANWSIVSGASDSAWTTAGCGSADDGGADNDGNGTGADRKATRESFKAISTSGIVVFDITSALAQAWYDGTAAENGVIFRDVDPTPGMQAIRSGDWYQNLDQNPYWRIVWHAGEAPSGQVIIISKQEEDTCVTYGSSQPPPFWDAAALPPIQKWEGQELRSVLPVQKQ